jgi:Copper type II ascorbate-dependent monooxygenase, C-terminal domain
MSAPRRLLPMLAGLAIVLWAVIALAQTTLPRGRAPRVVGFRDPIGPTARVTFNRDVAPLLQARCQKCHHEGGIAPFPLMTYADAYAHKGAMLVSTQNRTMPPWRVDSACAGFEDDPSLTPAEIATFSDWFDLGAVAGDPKDLPPPLTFSDGWELGTPDKVLAMSSPMTPDFSRGDVYRCFVMPTGLTEDRWVDAVEVLPGVGKMVHHVLLFVDTTSASEALDAADPGPGYSCFGGPGFTLQNALGGWVPGSVPSRLPEGIGLLLPKASRVVMQVHYSALSGVTAPDVTSVALHYATRPIRQQLRILPLINQSFVIPAGAKDHVVTASVPIVPIPVHVLSIAPHMHLLGRSMHVSTTLPGGSQKCLVDVPDWSFHWQRQYSFREPLALPAGSRLDLTAHYDNSEENPQNVSHPPREVRWGENTTDEMCIAFLAFTIDDENLLASAGASPMAKRQKYDPFWEVEWKPVPPPAPFEVPAHWSHH